MIEGRMDGKRGRRRKRIGMLDDLTKGEQYEQLKRRAEGRDLWRDWTPNYLSLTEN